MRKKYENISRKEAIYEIGRYAKYTALTALGTYLLLNPKMSQASSCPPNTEGCPGGQGDGFND